VWILKHFHSLHGKYNSKSKYLNQYLWVIIPKWFKNYIILTYMIYIYICIQLYSWLICVVRIDTIDTIYMIRYTNVLYFFTRHLPNSVQQENAPILRNPRIILLSKLVCLWLGVTWECAENWFWSAARSLAVQSIKYIFIQL
jgi:hypothetical protein